LPGKKDDKPDFIGLDASVLRHSTLGTSEEPTLDQLTNLH